ncbi:MAG TPA: urease accessory protein UreD [Polyangia bacterium]|nr:urease accessory protein UreD [Polyangia bacterium]
MSSLGLPSADDADADAGAGPRGWEAALDIAFTAADGGATLLARHRQLGPLAVQRAFAPEGPSVAHVTVLHPPGGLVGGDQLRITVSVERGAHGLCTTPAAAKHYRSAGATARQQQHLTVAAGGTLEWLPHENILFEGAISELSTRVDLEAGARFIGVDLICFGLPARDERFTRGRCRQRLELWRVGAGAGATARPLLIERGCFDGGAAVHRARWGLADAPVLGTLVATPGLQADHPALAAIRARAGDLPDGDLAVVTRLQPEPGDSLLCARYLGASAERGLAFLRDAWRLLRPPILGREAVTPRIWAT